MPPVFGLVIVGDEILSGRRTDKHLAKCIELLAAHGQALAWAEYVGDDPARITAVLRRAFASGEAVFCTGGIGATPDDHTRQCAAAALGVPLALHPGAKALIEERMREVAAEQGGAYDPRHPDNLHRLNMGVFPQGARLIPNPYNKIPGFSCDGPGGGAVHFVPGFPVMAWPMMDWVLTHEYAGRLARGEGWEERSVILYGAMEATLTPVMERVEAAHPQVKVFSLPSVDHAEHGRHIDLGVKGPPAAVAAAYADLRAWLQPFNLRYGPELVRP
ncbi:MAG: molybdopterin-binding protein [Comamonadaceae bacterium]|nr:molybdopterin-binding protein [Comamonadaceae bacterium]RRD56969.1 competence/damage-inducible protein A [Comamonadaceae bacterium OH2545_COT-014]